MIRVGVDTGGTFTDLILMEDGRIRVQKIPSEPTRPAEAICRGMRLLLGKDRRAAVVHGTTVATNTLLQRCGARTVLLTTRHFEDVLEIGRQNRPEMYNLFVTRPDPLVPSEQRLGVRERLDHDGRILIPLTDAEIRRVIRRIRSVKAESLAICLLHAYANPDHEKRLHRAARGLKIPISRSSEILPEYREYERCSSTVVNAYVAPIMERYLTELSERLGRSNSLTIMQSNGGGASAQKASAEPIRTLLSGPAAGVVGAHAVGKRIGRPRLITLDMGGTSTDVSLCPGEIRYRTEGEIAGCAVKTPLIQMHSIGAGGGSKAWIDTGGLLRVGPQSAGADPGPICYGKGGKAITVTDAHFLLGRLDSDGLLGGTLPLDRNALNRPFAQMARAMGLSPLELAEGIVQVTNAAMERALRVVSVEEGYDPSGFALFVYGGAGGLHCADLARSLKIPRTILPPHPGLFSAFGLLMADNIKEFSKGWIVRTDRIPRRDLIDQLTRMTRTGIKELRAEGILRRDIRIEARLDMRYEGQSHELTVPFGRDVVQTFHRMHARRYGVMDSNRPTEIVALRVRLTGKVPKPTLRPRPAGKNRNPRMAEVGRRTVYFSGRQHMVPWYRRERCFPGMTIPGPAILVEFSAVTVVPPDFQAEIDRHENLILEPKR